jgi:hypothetical protein
VQRLALSRQRQAGGLAAGEQPSNRGGHRG